MKKQEKEQQYIDDVDKMYAELDEAENVDVKKLNRKKALKIAGNTIFIILVVILVFSLIWIQIAKENDKTPMVFGFGLCYVETGSMEPTLPVGSIILVKSVKDTANIEEGEIVTFYDINGRRVTHRVQSRVMLDGEIVYITKGDNNNVEDILADGTPEYLTQDRIIAIMIKKLL